jgi:hypothetical protein
MNKKDKKRAIELLALAYVTDTENAIDVMEQVGQHELCTNTELPVDGSRHPAFEKMGIVFGDVCEDNHLFRQTTLPSGWKIESVSEYWSYLHDNKGRERAEIFYKSAFYDECAHIRPTVRYITKSHKPDTNRDYKQEVVFDNATQSVVFAMELRHDPGFENSTREERKVAYDLNDEDRKVTKQWLNEHYPNHDDPSAYWED